MERSIAVLETGKLESYVVAFRSGGVAGRPVEVNTSGSQWHQWAPDGMTLVVQDERNRLRKVSVAAGPELTVSAPSEVCDLDKLRISTWSGLPGGRLLVGLENANDEEIASYNLVLNWTEALKQKMNVAP